LARTTDIKAVWNPYMDMLFGILGNAGADEVVKFPRDRYQAFACR
jgi:hypothetical protein